MALTQTAQSTITPISSNEAKRARLLIVDDDSHQVRFYLNGLSKIYHCSFSGKAENALQLARQFPQPDLIILDVVMPEVNGFELCSMLKEDQLTAHIPVIFVSGQDDMDSKVKGFSLGCVDYIPKPVFIPEMEARISTHIKLKQQTQLLESLAYVDPLTEVSNRRKYNETIQREWARSIRYAQPLAMLIIDIDHFKQFNDFYGHGVGDDCLIKVASELKGVVHRPGDLFARIGGEEFVILLADCGIDGAEKKAQEVINVMGFLNIANQGAPRHDRVTVSIGVAVALPKAGDEALNLFQAADEALYEAKHRGRNQFKSSRFYNGKQA
ncbi:diguanylate cyclase [Glaciecola sp. MH2013]|uniref:GGDEF domain-containing response regulator n=1 Tax=Glaciecola sp. MH2013 TaxID=2785524 RepID=UPI00189CB147|nr:diguanylate cyclase [Glaciecola sp. MH2013]MBF7074363.1 diguanylate cyclase [Glaciecola sp. MH2013]